MADVKVRPTIDLARVYAGKGTPTELRDFVEAQHVLSDRTRALVHLRELNRELAAAVKDDPLPAGPARARAQKADKLLDRVLATKEKLCDFKPEQAILVGFASAGDFKAFTKAGHHFFDVGAGPVHGPMTHRIQWFIIMSEVTGGKFGAPVGYTHTPRELFAASMSDAYEIAAPTFSKKAWMWDWVVDRIAGLHAEDGHGGKLSDDYDPKEDAWTHPGETNQDGALSNDIVLDKDLGLETLAELRRAQIAGYDDVKAEMKRWHDLALKLGAAQGMGYDGLPSYFWMPTPQMVAAVEDQRLVVVALLREVRRVRGPEDVENVHLGVGGAWAAATENLDRLVKGTEQNLPQAILSAWFQPLLTAVAQARKAAKPGPSLLAACVDVEQSPAWTFRLA